MSDLRLPDVSEFQTAVEWPAVVHANGGAAIIRALYGSGHVDKLWQQGRRAAARKAGVHHLGIYQYLVKDQDPAAQAHAFVAAVGKLAPGEFAVLDLEEGTGDQSHRAKQWFDIVDAHLTYPGYHGAWLYSNASMLNSQLHAFLTGSHRPIWVAQYQPLTKRPTVSRYTLWQFTDGSQPFPGGHDPFPGIGHCDQSVFHGSLAAFTAAIHA